MKKRNERRRGHHQLKRRRMAIEMVARKPQAAKTDIMVKWRRKRHRAAAPFTLRKN